MNRWVPLSLIQKPPPYRTVGVERSKGTEHIDHSEYLVASLVLKKKVAVTGIEEAEPKRGLCVPC